MKCQAIKDYFGCDLYEMGVEYGINIQQRKYSRENQHSSNHVSIGPLDSALSNLSLNCFPKLRVCYQNEKQVCRRNSHSQLYFEYFTVISTRNLLKVHLQYTFQGRQMVRDITQPTGLAFWFQQLSLHLQGPRNIKSSGHRLMLI